MTAEKLAIAVLLNAEYLKESVDKGAEFGYSAYRTGDKRLTKGAIHNQIVSLRQILLELDRSIAKENTPFA